MKVLFSFIALLFCSSLIAQSEQEFKKQIRKSISELSDFVAIPNDANNHADINRNIYWLTDKFNQRGFNTSVLPTSGEDLFFAALPMQEDKETVLIYMHFDGQAVDQSKWDQEDPFKMVLKSPTADGWEEKEFSSLDEELNFQWRLFGRSTSDDKGPIVMLLNAIDMLKEQNVDLIYNIKVILDSEEEKSSAPLTAALSTYSELFEADYLLIGDGPMHPSLNPNSAVDEGVHVLIKLMLKSEPDAAGNVTIYFKLNGQLRTISIKDTAVKVEKSENKKASASNDKQIGAPLQGLLSSILVKRGEAVKKNQPLFIIEAMKMETTVTSNAEGVVKSIELKGGDLVNPDDLVLTLE